MYNFLNYLSGLSSLTEDTKAAVTAVTKRLELPKGYQLVKQNSVCNYFYFVESGLTRTFYYKDGKDITDWISAENSIAISLISFITRTPDRRAIELLEDSILFAIYYDDHEKLCYEYHDFERLARKLAAAGLVQMQKKFDDLHFASARERYQTLMETYPTFIQRVPLGMIASYLGMTQETLSRIRANIF